MIAAETLAEAPPTTLYHRAPSWRKGPKQEGLSSQASFHMQCLQALVEEGRPLELQSTIHPLEASKCAVQNQDIIRTPWLHMAPK